LKLIIWYSHLVIISHFNIEIIQRQIFINFDFKYQLDHEEVSKGIIVKQNRFIIFSLLKKTPEIIIKIQHKLNLQRFTHMTLEILGLGGAQEVGRSSFLLTENDHSLLLDAGLKLFPKRLDIPPLEPAVPLEKRQEFYSSLDAILVSHAHLDHIGYIPAAYHYGYRGKVYMTKPTADLADLVWADGLKIQGDRFYNSKDVERTKRNIIRLNYNQKIRLSDSASAVFYDAGHILGSAAIELDWDGQKILYTGDLSDQQTLLHTGHKIPTINDKYSFIISEATNHHHSKHIPRVKSSRNLIQSVLDNYKHKGKMIIPSFAVGRSQEILSILMTYLDDLLYSYPVYMAGAINKVNVIYEKYFNPNWINKEIIMRVKDQDKTLTTPWDHQGLKETQGFRAQKSIMKDLKPKIIVATHGMVETGPVHGFYQAAGSIGADILAGTKVVELGYGKQQRKVKLDLNQEKFSFSGHISRENLQELLTTMGSKHVITVHGETESMTQLNADLINNGLKATALPSMESITI
jgi:predicted metal-dependent RNase